MSRYAASTTVLMPSDAWLALVEYAARSSDVGGELRAVREALAGERERVDRVVNRAIAYAFPANPELPDAYRGVP